MKTRDEKKDVPSFDDLVFENRNKEYGAYEIRKKYDLTLIWAILVGVFCVSASVVTPFVIKPSPPIVIDQPRDSVTIDFDNTITNVDIPKPELPKPEAISVKPPAYVAPEVVDKISPEDAKKLLTNDEINSTIKNTNVDEQISEPKKDNPIPEDNNKIVEVFSVSEKPSFGIGGDNEFRTWVAENINYPQEPLDNGIQGRVFVQFIVEKDGSISNVIVVRSVDPELDKEAVRVVSLSPKWNPGKQQGDPVRVRFTFPITFSLK